MTPLGMPTTASRLCAECGLCCSGVLFHTVQLQPADSAKDLAARGIRLKRKHGHNFILQPCPALRNLQCSVYAERPERCRLFECRQLKRLAEGSITEAMALETIHEARRRVDQINELLRQAGKTNPKRPLSKRCEKAMAEPLSTASEQGVVARQSQLNRAMLELNALLDADFRIVPGVGPDAAELERDHPDEPNRKSGLRNSCQGQSSPPFTLKQPV